MFNSFLRGLLWYLAGKSDSVSGRDFGTHGPGGSKSGDWRLDAYSEGYAAGATDNQGDKRSAA